MFWENHQKKQNLLADCVSEAERTVNSCNRPNNMIRCSRCVKYGSNLLHEIRMKTYTMMLLGSACFCLAGCSAEDALYYAVYPFTWVDVKAVALSPNGEKVVASTGQVWDINGKNITQLDMVNFDRHIRFSNDSTRIVGVGDGGSALYDAQTGRRLWSNSESGEIHIVSVAFSADEKHVLVHVKRYKHPNNEHRIFQIAIETGKTVKTIMRSGDHYDHIVILAPNGRSFAVFEIELNSSKMNIYDVETENLVQHVTIPVEIASPLRTDYSRSAVFTQDSEKIILCSNHSVIIVDLQKQDDAVRNLGRGFPGPGSNASDALLDSDSRKLVVGSGTKVTVIDLETGRNIQEFDKHSWRVTSVALSADGKYVLSSCASSSQEYRPGVHYWDSVTGNIRKTFRAR